nr:merozoite surface antigen 2-like [Bactrocera oleae]
MGHRIQFASEGSDGGRVPPRGAGAVTGVVAGAVAGVVAAAARGRPSGVMEGPVRGTLVADRTVGVGVIGINMNMDTPMTPTPTVRSATNVPRTGPSITPLGLPRAAAATTPATAPATTPVTAPAPRGGTRPPSLPSEVCDRAVPNLQQTTSHATSSQLEARRRSATYPSKPRNKTSTRAVHPWNGTATTSFHGSEQRCSNATTAAATTRLIICLGGWDG